MNITYRKKIIAEIKTHNELEDFLIARKIYMHFKKFSNSDVLKVENSIKETNVLPYKKIKSWMRNILQYPETIYDKKYLRCMGWEEDELILFISDKQKHNSNILRNKKLNNPELFYDKTTSRIEYWLNKGFSLDDAKIKLKERQRTFSREICIKKHGEELGVNIFNERQNKWIKSLQALNNYAEVQLKKNIYDYENKSYETLINGVSFLDITKNLILKNIRCDDINEFVDNILTEIDVKRYSDIQSFFTSKIIQTKYGMSSDEIKNIFYSKTFYTLVKQTYGIPIYHNSIRFKSVKEYQLALFFEEKNIEYVYERNYPNSNFKFDFYLPQKNLYVEYYGMLDGKNENKLNKLQKEYKNKMISKNLYCQENNLPLIFDTSYNDLLQKLKEVL